jgi:two-component system, NarL family, invasion response regulator UvrY
MMHKIASASFLLRSLNIAKAMQIACTLDARKYKEEFIMIKLMVADDHTIMIEGIRHTLIDSGIELVGHTLIATEVVDVYRQLKPDVLICDIRFGQEAHGLDVLVDLLKVEPGAKVIIFSQFLDDKYIFNTYDFGAKAFVVKSISEDELIHVIKKVNSGDMHFDKEIALKMVEFNYKLTDTKSKDIIGTLSAREVDVLRHLANGLTDKEVAIELNIAPRTVANVKQALKTKLNLHKQADITKFALRHNLIALEDNFQN